MLPFLKIKQKISVVFIIVFVCFFIFAKDSFAAVGANLGTTNINEQISIIDDVLEPNNAGAGFPVGLNINIGADETEIHDLAEKVKSNNYFPLITVREVCGDNLSDITHTIEEIRDDDNFGERGVVIFGYEINKDANCPSLDNYKNNYEAVRSIANLAPATLDWYDLNNDPQTKIYGDSSLATIFSSSSLRAVNAYGCRDKGASFCNPETTQTHFVAINDVQVQRYVFEFSLFDQEVEGEIAPDTNLKNVKQFIKYRNSDLQATHVTPLVRNVCTEFESEGNWLYYVKGSFYTKMNTKISDDNCAALTEEIVKTYQTKNPDDYYLYPLKINPDISLMENMIVDQGYQAFCAAKEIRIKKEVINQANMQKYYDIGYTLNIEQSDPYLINIDDAVIPMLRGDEDSKTTIKTSSLEAYFSAIDFNKEYDPLKTGVINSLITNEQQCVLKMEKVRVAKELCELLEESDQEKCAMHQAIPYTKDEDTNEEYFIYSTSDQHNNQQYSLWYLVKANETTEVDNKLTCQELSLPYNSDSNTAKTKVNKEKFLQIQNAVDNMSINLDMVYRVAFLVIAPHQTHDQSQNKDFWFLGDDYGSVKEEKYAPIILAFKIPDFITNKSYTIYNMDAAEHSTNAFKSADIITKQYQKEKERREKYYQKALGKKSSRESGNSSSLEVYAKFNSLDNTKNLKEILLDIINASDQSCKPNDPRGEDYALDPVPEEAREFAGEISTPASVEEGDGRNFKSQYDSEMFPETEQNGMTWQLQADTFNEASSQIVDNQDNEEGIPVTVHIVAPLGANLEMINNAMKMFFASDIYESMETNTCLPDSVGTPCGHAPEYYPLQNSSLMYNSIQTITYQDPDCDDPINGCPLSFSVKLDDKNEGFHILGAKLGWLVRKAQEAFRAIETKAHDYIITCERVEDMFLGRCGSQYAYLGDQDVTRGSGDCSVINDSSNPCDVERLKKALKNSSYASGLSESQIQIRAENASMICNKESGGSPSSLNTACLQGISLDYSVGLYQINLLAHDIKEGDRSSDPIKLNCPKFFTYSKGSTLCRVIDQSKANECVNTLKKPEENIQKALEISQGFRTFSAWSSARPEFCNIP